MRISSVVLLISGLFASLAASAQIIDSTQIVAPGRANSAAQQQKPYVIFISADGFRYDLADKYHATNLLALREKGVAAKAMRPSYPSVTFPNHYSLATGLYPAHDGLVDNTFFDPKKGRGYRISDRTAVEDSSWYGGVPLWVLAERQKMVSASFFWVGSETAVDGVRPTYYYRFNDKISVDTRLQAVKDWLTLPEDKRPHLILFYMSWVDHAEHLYGPDSKETEAAVHLVDDVMGRMTRMVDSLRLPVNYVFISDHGMAATDTAHGVLIPAAIDTSKFRLSIDGTMLHLYAKDKKDIPGLYKTLKAAAAQSPSNGAAANAGSAATSGSEAAANPANPNSSSDPGFDVYYPNETPAYWHYRKSDDRYGRIGDILLVTHFPRVFVSPGHMHVIPGEHGYDNAIPDMGATFYAWGPAFHEHQVIDKFDNVNVYPLIAHILGLTISEPIDGSFKTLRGTLK
jgi:predicted AlkP superfamily pyrophosphatase or phosphodiesterase